MSNCMLGVITNPINNWTYQTDVYPLSIPLTVQVQGVYPSQYYVQVSTSPLFLTQDATFNGNPNLDVVISKPGTYYLRISCDNVTWSGSIIFNVESVASSSISSITELTITENENNTSLDIVVPQLVYGPKIVYNEPLNEVVPEATNAENAIIVELAASTDPNMVQDVSYQYYYPAATSRWGYFNLPINNLQAATIYYVACRIFTTTTAWEPYSQTFTITTGGGNVGTSI